HFDNVGTCVIDANQAAAGDYSAAPQMQQTVSVTSYRLYISVPPPFAATSSPTANFVIFLIDQSNSQVPAPHDFTVTLSSSSSGGVFAATAGGPPTATITLPAGQPRVYAYYGDTQAGTPTLTASTTGAGTSTRAWGVNAGPPAALRFAQEPTDG